jgi:AcrR family transcriptional regulator
MGDLPSSIEHYAERSVATARDRARGEIRNVLDAAQTVVRRAGWRGFKVESVLREGQISTRGFYRHFRKRSELLLAMLQQTIDRQAEWLRARTEAGAGPVGKVNAWIDGALDVFYREDYVQEAHLFRSEWYELMADYPNETARCLDALAAPLAEALESGLAVGAFPGVRPAQDATATLHLVMGVAATHGMGTLGPARPRDEVDAVVRPYALRALCGAQTGVDGGRY